MRHVSLTCKNHPDLRWSCKEIAFEGGSYNGSRSIFFKGIAVLDEEGLPKLYADKSGTMTSGLMADNTAVIECSCPASDLIKAPEDEVLELAFRVKYG
jgi:hypothetical protein